MTIYSLDVILSQFGTSLLFPCPVLTVVSAYRFHRGQVRCSGIPISLRIFQFVVIHTVKGFSMVIEGKVKMVSWNSFAFSMIQQMLAIWSLVSLPFLNPACTSGSFQFMSIEASLGEFWALPSCHVRWVQLCSSLNILWHCLSLGLEWKLTFTSPVATFESPNLLTYWVQHFNSITF